MLCFQDSPPEIMHVQVGNDSSDCVFNDLGR